MPILLRLAGLAGLAALLCACGDATGMPLPREGDAVVGEVLRVRLKQEMAPLDLAQRYAVGLTELVRANPRVTALREARLPAGTELVVPTRFVLPEGPREGIVVNIAEKRLYYYDGGEVLSFAAAVGRDEWETPTGRTHVAERIVNPEWYPPPSIREEHARKEGRPLPEVVPPGPDNPLGRYALRLGWRKHLIHGTNNPRSVGKPVTHGCIRLYPDDIETLFESVKEGTPVTLVDQPYKLGTDDGALFLESHPDGPTAQAQRRQILQRIEAWAREKKGRRVNKTLVEQVLVQSSGIPVRVSE